MAQKFKAYSVGDDEYYCTSCTKTFTYTKLGVYTICPHCKVQVQIKGPRP